MEELICECQLMYLFLYQFEGSVFRGTFPLRSTHIFLPLPFASFPWGEASQLEVTRVLSCSVGTEWSHFCYDLGRAYMSLLCWVVPRPLYHGR